MDLTSFWKELYQAELAQRDYINGNGQLLINIIALEAAGLFFLLSDSGEPVQHWNAAAIQILCFISVILASISALFISYGFHVAKTAHINSSEELSKHYLDLKNHDGSTCDQLFSDFLANRYKDVAALNASRNDKRSEIFFHAKQILIGSSLFFVIAVWIYTANIIDWSAFNVCR